MNTLARVNPLAHDLDSILNGTPTVWDELRGASIFITGGTGFIGCWMLESFLHANKELDLGAKAIVLTRDPHHFVSKAPAIANDSSVQLIEGDVRDFSAPRMQCSHIIHAAAETKFNVQGESAEDAMDVNLRGTKRVLDMALECGAEKVLLTSSGAVYSSGVDVVEDSYPSKGAAPSPYGESKRLVEESCLEWAHNHPVEMKIARCFTFMGPYLPVDRSFAAGNFIRDAAHGGPIRAQANSGSYRSYMYAADMAVWLWTIYAKGQSGRPYNVGSTHRLSTVALAEEIAEVAGVKTELYNDVELTPSLACKDYVPNTLRARTELSLTEAVGLREAIRRTLAWYQDHPSSSLNH